METEVTTPVAPSPKWFTAAVEEGGARAGASRLSEKRHFTTLQALAECAEG